MFVPLRVFLDPASKRGMTYHVTLHSMRTVSPRTVMRGPASGDNGMHEARPAYGRKQEKEQTKDRGAKGNPAFIGQGEGKSEEGTGRGVSELTASSAAPDDGAAPRPTRPDNSGGASWFVLLAVEKNEQLCS
ncbi:hypothetical protein B5G10_12470, partial [Barnesiella sp. An55]